MNTYELLKIGSTTLKEKKIVSYDLDSEILLAKVLKKNRQDLIRNLTQKIHKKYFLKYSNFIERRSNHEPIAYILNQKRVLEQIFLCNKRYFDTKTRNRTDGRSIDKEIQK